MGPSGSAGADRGFAAAVSGPLRRTDAFSSAFEAAAPAGRPGKDPPSSSPGGSFLLHWAASGHRPPMRPTEPLDVDLAKESSLFGKVVFVVATPVSGADVL